MLVDHFKLTDDKIQALWKDNDGKDPLEDLKKSLFEHYTTLQNSQAIRLIGFVTGLFTLLGLAQASKVSKLSEIFANFPTIIVFGNSPQLWDFLKVIFLFMGVSIIIFLILRAIFRFAVFGTLSSEAAYITTKDARQVVVDYAKDEDDLKAYRNRAMWVIEIAASRLSHESKVLWLPITWFISFSDPKYPCNKNVGHFVVFASSLVVAFLLILFLW